MRPYLFDCRSTPSTRSPLSSPVPLPHAASSFSSASRMQAAAPSLSSSAVSRRDGAARRRVAALREARPGPWSPVADERGARRPGAGSVGAVAASSAAAGAQSQPWRCTSAEDHGVNDEAAVRPCLGSGWICLRSSRMWCRPPFKGETGRRQPSVVARRGAEVAWRGCPADGSSLPAPSLSSCAAGRHGAGRKQLGHYRAIMAER